MLTAKSTRAGRFIRQPTGYDAFIPAPLPPEPPLELQGDVAVLLAGASVALGRLDGILGILPNPDLFVAMYVRQEAVLSSQESTGFRRNRKFAYEPYLRLFDSMTADPEAPAS